jgi:hypothetical protein
LARLALALNDLVDAFGQVTGGRGVVLRGVRDAEAAAEVELLELDAAGVADLRLQLQHAAGGHLEAAGVEDLRADVRVQAAQVEDALVEDLTAAAKAAPAGQREAELLVLVGGGDELVGVSLDTDGDADEHARLCPIFGQSRSGRFRRRVDDDPAHARLERAGQFGHDLLLPWKPICSAGKPAASATASSPPEHTSRNRPSSSTIRTTALHRNDLPA